MSEQRFDCQWIRVSVSSVPISSITLQERGRDAGKEATEGSGGREARERGSEGESERG